MIDNEKIEYQLLNTCKLTKYILDVSNKKTIAENNDSRMSQNKEEDEMYANLDDEDTLLNMINKAVS